MNIQDMPIEIGTPDVQMKEIVSVEFYEKEMNRQERANKRMWVLTIILIVSLVLSNALWIWYINQYDFESTDIAQDGQGVNIVGDNNYSPSDEAQGA